jgi:phosphohistidine phosphatase
MPGALLATDPRLDVVPDVVIDDTGVFKYILCKVYLADTPAVLKHIVRGTKRAEFHAGIYDDIETRLTDTGISCECIGGGKIDHDPVQKTIIVYGLSQGFGRANHEQSVELLKRKYPQYASITWRND